MALLCYRWVGARASGISLGWEVSEGFLGPVPSTGHGYKCAGQRTSGWKLPGVGNAVGLRHPITQPECSRCSFPGRRPQADAKGCASERGGLC